MSKGKTTESCGSSSGDPADWDFDLALFAWASSPFPSFNPSLYGEELLEHRRALPVVDGDLDAHIGELVEDYQLGVLPQAVAGRGGDP